LDKQFRADLAKRRDAPTRMLVVRRPFAVNRGDRQKHRPTTDLKSNSRRAAEAPKNSYREREQLAELLAAAPRQVR
jgi:hypothetical protein